MTVRIFADSSRPAIALQQSIEHARPKDFDAVLARTARALAGLRTQHTKGTLPLLRLPEKRDDIATILGYATLLRDGASDVVFLGTGGSSLGGQTLAQLAGYAVPGVRALRPSQRVRAKRGPMTRLRECRNP